MNVVYITYTNYVCTEYACAQIKASICTEGFAAVIAMQARQGMMACNII